MRTPYVKTSTLVNVGQAFKMSRGSGTICIGKYGWGAALENMRNAIGGTWDELLSEECWS